MEREREREKDSIFVRFRVLVSVANFHFDSKMMSCCNFFTDMT